MFDLPHFEPARRRSHVVAVLAQASSALLVGVLTSSSGCSTQAIGPALVPALQLQARLSLGSSVGRLVQHGQVRAVLIFSEPPSRTPALPVFEAADALVASGAPDEGLGMLSGADLQALCGLDRSCMAELVGGPEGRGVGW